MPAIDSKGHLNSVGSNDSNDDNNDGYSDDSTDSSTDDSSDDRNEDINDDDDDSEVHLNGLLPENLVDTVRKIIILRILDHSASPNKVLFAFAVRSID